MVCFAVSKRGFSSRSKTPKTMAKGIPVLWLNRSVARVTGAAAAVLLAGVGCRQQLDIALLALSLCSVILSTEVP